MSVVREKTEASGRQVCWLPMERVKPNPRQPRKEFNELALMELASSIRQHGLLQPITVRKAGGDYEIVMGERRYRACAMLGFTHIDAFILPAEEGESAILALIENLQRENLHFFEEAEAYADLLKKGIILVDLPGVGSLTLANQSATLNYLKRSSAATIINRSILAARNFDLN